LARLLKCYGSDCSKFPKEEMKEFKGKNYCEKCYEEEKKNSEGYKTFLEVVTEAYSIPYPTGLMLRQAKNFRNDRNYEYEDQAIAILYIKNILRKEMNTKFGLGLIPYVIDDAKKFYIDQKQKMEDMKEKDFHYEIDVIKKKKVEFDKHSAMKNKLIDMEKIL